MRRLFQAIFGQGKQASRSPAPPAARTAFEPPPAPPRPPRLPAPAPAPGKVLIPGPTAVYEKDLSSPFWAGVAKMQPGSFVKYESISREWHVFVVVEGPRYGRPGVNDVSVAVRRVTTQEQFTMPAYLLSPCDAAFRSRDGTPIRRGESLRGR